MSLLLRILCGMRIRSHPRVSSESIPGVNGRHLLAPVKALGVVAGIAAVARLAEQERDPTLAEHTNIEYEQRLQQIHNDVAVHQRIVFEPRQQQRDPAGAHDRVQQNKHPEAVLHLVMDPPVRTHPLDPVRRGQHEAQIDYNGEGDAHEHHGDAEPAHGLLRGISRAAHGELVRLQGEVGEHRGDGDARGEAPDP